MTYEQTTEPPYASPNGTAEPTAPPVQDPPATGPLTGVFPEGWDVDRSVRLMAGTMTLVSLALGRVHHRRWRMMTALIGANLILQAFAGWCPSSLALRRLGVPDRSAKR